jgi:threonine aldolase
MLIDLRSDTVTKPTPEMLQAMFSAKVGNDVFGDDPTVNLLQEKVASYFGMESALFFPSGTMANQIAIKTHTQPGDELICDFTSHVYRYEGGGIAANSGVSARLLQGERGIFTAEDVQGNIHPNDVHFPRTSLVVIENTVNKGGGICWTDHQISSVSDVAQKNGLALHLDGARLWNALVFTKQNPLHYGKWFDSISVCFSKGMGCPIGSVLLGKSSFIDQAKRHRKRFGGGMRQVGYLAAACVYAMDHHIERLDIDHSKALAMQSVLKQLAWVENVMPVQTNIVLFKTKNAQFAEGIVSKLKEADILAVSTGEGWIRFVCHLDIKDEMLETLEKVLKQL